MGGWGLAHCISPSSTPVVSLLVPVLVGSCPLPQNTDNQESHRVDAVGAVWGLHIFV